MDDKIYRQQAIDILTRLEPSFSGSVLEQALKNMPPAQPEIIRCKDCRHLLLTGGKARRMTLFEALQPDSPYVFYSDDHGFCINTADVMDILTMDKESVIYRQAAIDDIGKDVERREE